MGKHFGEIDEALAAWIRAQRMFFVATAPLARDGHVNLSPKGLESLAILGPQEVAYLDFIGSGAETIAHARENGRTALMLCAFEGPPRIVRLQGRASVVEPDEAEYDALAANFAPHPSARAVIRIALTRITDSCGYGVPLMRFEGERTQLGAWAERKGADGLRQYQLDHNLRSIDGLPALRAARLRS